MAANCRSRLFCASSFVSFVASVNGIADTTAKTKLIRIEFGFGFCVSIKQMNVVQMVFVITIWKHRNSRPTAVRSDRIDCEISTIQRRKVGAHSKSDPLNFNADYFICFFLFISFLYCKNGPSLRPLIICERPFLGGTANQCATSLVSGQI